MKLTPRHTLLRTAAALTLLLPALTACTIVSRTVPAADEPITFASFLPDVTKAGVVESADDMSEFAVWGWHTAAGAAPTDIFDGERIYRDGTGVTAPWTYDVPRFWVEGSYDFYALHPAPFTKDDGSGVTAEVTAEVTADGITSITLNSPNADIDLMTATATRKYSPATPDASAVSFTFEHLLVKVSIVVRTEGLGTGTVSLMNLQLKGPELTATYYPQSGWSDLPEVPEDESTLIDYKPDDPSGVVLTDKGVIIVEDRLLIPTDQPSAYSVVINYMDGSSQKTSTAELPSIPIWQPGESYIYTLTIKGDYIGFDRPLVDDWDDADGGIIIVD